MCFEEIGWFLSQPIVKKLLEKDTVLVHLGTDTSAVEGKKKGCQIIKILLRVHACSFFTSNLSGLTIVVCIDYEKTLVANIDPGVHEHPSVYPRRFYTVGCAN